MMLGDLGAKLDLAQGRTQLALQRSVNRLSSGLRVNSAVDDPSGLAIATGMQTQSMGLDAGAESVQTAANALTVADGALSSVTSILQRIRALIVAGRSDLASAGDKADTNSEITALLHEVNTIAQGTSFNGTHLLDGSLSNAVAQPSLPVVPANDPLSSGAPILDPTQLNVQPTGSPLNFAVMVDAYDPVTGLLTVSYDIKSPDPKQTFDQPYPTTTTILAGTNYDNFWNTFGGPIPPGVDLYQISDAAGNPLMNFALNNLSPTDVGKTAFVYNSATVPAQTGSPVSVAVGDHEGNAVGIGVNGVSTAQLGLAYVGVYPADLNSEGSEYRVDAAITQVGSQRADVGAMVVALQETVANANTDSLNLTAAQSGIRDLNVAQETTAFTSEQILAQTQTFLRSSTDMQAGNILKLFA